MSWPGWLTYSGWLTHISGQDSSFRLSAGQESSSAKDRRSTAVPCNQPTTIHKVSNSTTLKLCVAPAPTYEHLQSAFFVMVCSGMAYWHLFHAAGKFCEISLKHAAAVLVLDVCTSTFSFLKKGLQKSTACMYRQPCTTTFIWVSC